LFEVLVLESLVVVLFEGFASKMAEKENERALAGAREGGRTTRAIREPLKERAPARLEAIATVNFNIILIYLKTEIYSFTELA